MTAFISVNEPLLDGNEKKYLMECIDSGWISSEGPFVRDFEERFAAMIGRKHGISVCNGTAAIDAAVEALGIGPGDEVIMPTFTIISCVLQIVRSGATPVLVDADPITWNMNVSQLEEKITSRTKAIFVAHIYGLPVEMDRVLELASRYNLRVLEDAAEAIGQTYHGMRCGSFGDISTVSFYPNKHVTTGEGGMILTDDDQLAESCRGLRNLCFKQSRRFEHDRLGWNFRMTNIQAAIGLAQLERLEEFVMRKKLMGERYRNLLADIDELQQPLHGTDYADNLYWVYGLVLNDSIKINAQQAIEFMSKAGVGCRPFFFPLHKQPALLKVFEAWAVHEFPVAERLAERGFYIPSGLNLNVDQQVIVASALRSLIKGAVS